jgi:hypothetical protein
MGLTGVYNASVPEDVAISLIKHAFSKGITFFDTSDFYGLHVNEVLVGKVLLRLLLQLNTLYLHFCFQLCNINILITISGIKRLSSRSNSDCYKIWDYQMGRWSSCCKW